jgi:hypothetical protein
VVWTPRDVAADCGRPADICVSARRPRGIVQLCDPNHTGLFRV